MRWVFEICLFEPNGELQISEARFLAGSVNYSV